ncbi:hypothetical protein GCM10023333_02280 [Ferrimonas pelagia]|uniref:Uncharacterized protein n=1 Tax=Ferrimonas pelagia TaxID=1177826 RepID=A0ABP9ECU2_9GAMM
MQAFLADPIIKWCTRILDPLGCLRGIRTGTRTSTDRSATQKKPVRKPDWLLNPALQLGLGWHTEGIPLHWFFVGSVSHAAA